MLHGSPLHYTYSHCHQMISQQQPKGPQGLMGAQLALLRPTSTSDSPDLHWDVGIALGNRLVFRWTAARGQIVPKTATDVVRRGPRCTAHELQWERMGLLIRQVGHGTPKGDGTAVSNTAEPVIVQPRSRLYAGRRVLDAYTTSPARIGWLAWYLGAYMHTNVRRLINTKSDHKYQSTPPCMQRRALYAFLSPMPSRMPRLLNSGSTRDDVVKRHKQLRGYCGLYTAMMP